MPKATISKTPLQHLKQKSEINRIIEDRNLESIDYFMDIILMIDEWERQLLRKPQSKKSSLKQTYKIKLPGYALGQSGIKLTSF